MSYRYQWDVKCANVELKRLQDGFTDYDHFNFAAVLARNFMATQAIVHIETGSLHNSGQAEVTRSGKRRWEGEIRYGGISGGVNNPVRYAASELFGRSLRYGGDHNYLRPTQHIDDEMVGPVASFISRGRRTPHPHRTLDEFEGQG